jgi:integrase
MSRATFNRITAAVVERAKNERLPLEHFTVHDLRRTGSTLLNELGFNSDWRAVRIAVGIRCGAFSGNMKVSFQAARSIG